MGLGMMAWMLLFWIGVILLAIWIAAWLFPAVPAAPSPSARDILDARYARGELTPEQYRRMRREISAPGPRGLSALVAALAVALILLALVGMWGGWGPGYRPGGWPWWMPHMGGPRPWGTPGP